MATTRPIDLQELSTYFKMPEKAVAKHLGICLTSLKKICRAHGVTRWPYRKIKSLDKKLKKLEVAMSSSSDPSIASFFPSGPSHSSSGSTETSVSPVPSSSPSSSSASMASTPRQVAASAGSSHSCSFAPSPVQLGEAGKAAHSALHASFCEASGEAFGGDFGVLHPIAVAVEAIVVQPAAEDAARAELEAITSQAHHSEDIGAPEYDRDRSPSPDVSDEDLIAMLAQCAGTEGAGGRQHPCTREGSAPIVSAPASGSMCSKAGEGMTDYQIMQALVGCYAFPCSMEEEQQPNFADDHMDLNHEEQSYPMLEVGRA
mmetsp:Transcript_6999/g.16000  ORF Transcript_6999/g.16000 Transcript_6999/m.16000 type:complete len:316 (-) Transcript_6999:523-1470(-)|eukprot:CAMPEP_0114128010 /NCGR_PEP_ID=MMETSP0043_2-20121206/10702_1 /TAXON_ID=464988 /ORGANISM="Hemiselmis andersenii, Strain CCMP644" /LENGTH=315 /DNA_ID=CAMNT_0001221167 /DNA_START=901 /DNA_END=1848 /DNA_ORIENTATION=+